MNAAEMAEAFALSPEDVATLASALKEARLTVLRASYQRSARVAGVSAAWQPDVGLLLTIEAEAAQVASSIAATYQADLLRFLEKELAAEKAWKQAGIGDIMAKVRSWLASHLPWKSKQIANAICGQAANDGVEQFLDDVDTGGIDLGAAASTLWIGVVPEQSSSDFCRDYAGTMYPIEDADVIPEFPAHVNCIHTKVLINA